ncbi:MAG: antitoxin [Calditrichaeota bacterium]|nr:MAG: antitoxin [Calditrichota bacterium]
MRQTITKGDLMKKEYDLSKMQSRRNPYAKKLKKQVTLRMGEDIVEYFKQMADETGIPYQSLINLYLRDCVASNRKLQMNWLSHS